MYNRYVREDGGAYTRVPEPDTPPRAEEKPPYRPQQASRPFSPPPPPDEEEAQAPEAKFLDRLLAKLHLGDIDSGDLLLLLILFFLFREEADEELLIALGLLLIL